MYYGWRFQYNDGFYKDQCEVTVDSTVNVTDRSGYTIGRVKVYPNPASEVLNIQFSEPNPEHRIQVVEHQVPI